MRARVVKGVSRLMGTVAMNIGGAMGKTIPTRSTGVVVSLSVSAVCSFSMIAAWRWLHRVSVNAFPLDYLSLSVSSQVSIICWCLSLACHRYPRRFQLSVGADCSVLVCLASHALCCVVALVVLVALWQRRVIEWLSLISSELLVIGHRRGTRLG